MDLWYSYWTHDGVMNWGLIPSVDNCEFWSVWIEAILRMNDATRIAIGCTPIF